MKTECKSHWDNPINHEEYAECRECGERNYYDDSSDQTDVGIGMSIVDNARNTGIIHTFYDTGFVAKLKTSETTYKTHMFEFEDENRTWAIRETESDDIEGAIEAHLAFISNSFEDYKQTAKEGGYSKEETNKLLYENMIFWSI